MGDDDGAADGGTDVLGVVDAEADKAADEVEGDVLGTTVSSCWTGSRKELLFGKEREQRGERRDLSCRFLLVLCLSLPLRYFLRIPFRGGQFLVRLGVCKSERRGRREERGNSQ